MTQQLIIDGNEVEVSKINQVDSNRNGMSIDQLNDGSYILTLYGSFNAVSKVELP